MPNSYSLHLGLNQVDPLHYQKLPHLRAAVNDARDWAQMAQSVLGYASQEILLDEQASSEALFQRLKILSEKMQAGDALLLTYAGHGGQLDDPQSPKPGDEAKDETWCLYDRQVVDDELQQAFSQFRAGVRISVIADCCHSGTGIKAFGADTPAAEIAAWNAQLNIEKALGEAGFVPRRLGERTSRTIFRENTALYQEVLQRVATINVEVKAAVQLFAACQDDQVTFDGQTNGIFTDAFKTLLYSGEWRQLRSREALLERLRTFFRYPRPNHQEDGLGLAVFDQDFPLLAILPLLDDNTPAHRESAERLSAPLEPADTARPAPDFYKIKIEFPDGKLNEELLKSLCPGPTTKIRIEADAQTAYVWFAGANFPSTWEPVHHIAEQADAQKINLYVEPVLQPSTPLVDDTPLARAAGEDLDYLPFWPPKTAQPEAPPPLGWHLSEQHSQLAEARDFVWEKIKSGALRENIRIAHLDTGWYPWQPGLEENTNIRRDLSRSFVDKEKGINDAAVDLRYKKSEQHGHGTGTLGVLAGWTLDTKHTDGQDIGFIGAIPFAEVVPLRIADNVIIWDAENVCEALEYAMEIGCEVITLSMGGKPTKRMAQLINRAYESGITIVSAGGNNMAKGLASVGPKTLVYPARFQRVLAACGACFNQIPYDFDAQEKYGGKVRTSDIRYMQGNWGPAGVMNTALAAYSPNITWLYQDDEERQPIRKNGGGTSAVTPQVASAAALWIVLHKDELKKRGYHGTWKQVEAVRQALFQTADKSFEESERYYGNGIIRAMDALQVQVPDIGDDRISEKASSSLLGLREALGLFFKRQRAAAAPGPALQRSLELELRQLLLDDAELAGVEAVDGERDEGVIRAAVLRAEGCSDGLRGVFWG